MIGIYIKQGSKWRLETFNTDIYTEERAISTAKRYFRLKDGEGYQLKIIKVED